MNDLHPPCLVQVLHAGLQSSLVSPLNSYNCTIPHDPCLTSIMSMSLDKPIEVLGTSPTYMAVLGAQRFLYHPVSPRKPEMLSI